MAAEWREFAVRELRRELDTQILPDGADFESSTGYHRFVTEMLLYSVILWQRSCGAQEFARQHLEKMLRYLKVILRPDRRMPLIGDADGSQIVPMVKRGTDDVEYLLSLGAITLSDHKLKPYDLQPEILWLFGSEGVQQLQNMGLEQPIGSQAFANAGSYVTRDRDLYLLFNVNDVGANGRGSHAHNDALSIEISAFDRPFIVDPGSYAYNLDREARQLFRSTRYHSTLEVDGVEQNTTPASMPFLMGNEARPRVLAWESTRESDRVIAEHYGYARLPEAIIHRRTITFDKGEKYWLISDLLSGKGEHRFSFSFHLGPALRVDSIGDRAVRVSDDKGKALLIDCRGIAAAPQVVPAYFSRGYGHREPSSLLRWETTATAPLEVSFTIVPCFGAENERAGLELLRRLAENSGT
jgi:hypothetical protein